MIYIISIVIFLGFIDLYNDVKTYESENNKINEDIVSM